MLLTNIFISQVILLCCNKCLYTHKVELCWAPMLADFSGPLEQSDDDIVIAQCLVSFQYAISVTEAMSMKTHRDAFVTSLVKFIQYSFL